MTMSIGRLLAAGKSMAVGHVRGRYRVDKRVQLPKFNSPKNPFAAESKVQSPESRVQSQEKEVQSPESKVQSLEPAAVVEVPEQLREPNITMLGVPPSGGSDTRPPKGGTPNKLPVKTLADLAARGPEIVGAKAVRAVKWVGEVGKKFNPLPLLARRRGPARSAFRSVSRPAVQTELSLDSVKVMRNDLSDADLEVVVSKTAPARPKERVELVPVEEAAASGNPFSRVSEWMFGAKSS
jgi:hypothetical protein